MLVIVILVIKDSQLLLMISDFVELDQYPVRADIPIPIPGMDIGIRNILYWVLV